MLSLSVVLLLAGYFLVLAFISFFRPELARSFLLGFAGNGFKHYLELFIRIVAGTSLIFYSPKMFLGQAFLVLGSVLVVTTAVMLFIPWPIHRRFAEKTVPEALKYLTLIAVSSAAIGGFIIFSLVRGTP